jgi:predicted transglutaminase-like cysteine proteinase
MNLAVRSGFGRSLAKLGFVLIAVLALDAAGATSALAAGKHAPLGYQLMCLKSPKSPECNGGGKAEVKLTRNVMATVARVNAQVNRSITPRYDPAGRDVWTTNASIGDCEDYVLTKRRALIEAGIPASSLRIAYVKTRRGEDHAILVVKSDGRDIVLDNLTGSIKPLNQTGYRVISMSGANPRYWS